MEDKLKDHVLSTYLQRSVFAGCKEEDVAESLLELTAYVAGYTERRIKNGERKKFVNIRSFYEPTEAQVWVNAIARVTELVDVSMTLVREREGDIDPLVWVTVTTLESLTADNK